MSIGELHATFVFEVEEEAKAAWEQAMRESRYLSIYRWAMVGGEPAGQAITVLGEDSARFQKAAAILKATTSREVQTPQLVLDALRERRGQAQAQGIQRRVTRHGKGIVLWP